MDSEYSESEYASDEEYNEELIQRVLRELQAQQRRSYHMDAHGIPESAQEATRRDVSSATDCESDHNHNVRVPIETESDNGDWEQNYMYRASQHSRMRCDDWQDCLL